MYSIAKSGDGLARGATARLARPTRPTRPTQLTRQPATTPAHGAHGRCPDLPPPGAAAAGAGHPLPAPPAPPPPRRPAPPRSPSSPAGPGAGVPTRPGLIGSVDLHVRHPQLTEPLRQLRAGLTEPAAQAVHQGGQGVDGQPGLLELGRAQRQ